MWIQKLTSRKFLSMVVLVAIVLGNHFYGWGLGPQDLLALAIGVVGFIVGEGVVDQSYAKANAVKYSAFLAARTQERANVENALAEMFRDIDVEHPGPEVTE